MSYDTCNKVSFKDHIGVCFDGNYLVPDMLTDAACQSVFNAHMPFIYSFAIGETIHWKMNSEFSESISGNCKASAKITIPLFNPDREPLDFNICFVKKVIKSYFAEFLGEERKKLVAMKVSILKDQISREKVKHIQVIIRLKITRNNWEKIKNFQLEDSKDLFF